MGPDAHLRRLQRGCSGLFLYLLFPLPGALLETPQVCHLVSVSRLISLLPSIPEGWPTPLHPPTPCTRRCMACHVWLRACVCSHTNLRVASRHAPHLLPRRSRILGLIKPVLPIRWSVGSLLFLLSWAVLMGPWVYAKHLVSGPRLPFTAAYFGSIALTLYFAIGVSRIMLVLPCLPFLSACSMTPLAGGDFSSAGGRRTDASHSMDLASTCMRREGALALVTSSRTCGRRLMLCAVGSV